MSADRYLELFRTYRSKKLFRTADFPTLLDRDYRSVRVELSRLVARGLFSRVAKGWYANPFNPPSPDDLAMVLRSPAYLSLEAALARHGVLSQSPSSMTLVTTDLPRTFLAMGTTFEYHHIKPAYFTGFSRAGCLDMAEPEKALADLIYLRHVRSRELDRGRLRSLLDDMDLELLRRRKLRRLARLMRILPVLDHVLA